jgi:hypothetical protein
VSAVNAFLLLWPIDGIFCSFLNDLDRVTDRGYTVTDDDVVRARLRTIGIQEYKITFKERLLDKGPFLHPQ